MRRNSFFLREVRWIAVFCMAIIFLTAALTDDVFADTEESGRIDAVSYKMSLSLDTEKDCLKETVIIKVKNNTRSTVSELVLRDMTPAILKYDKANYSTKNKNKTTKITSVTIKGKKRKLDLTYQKGKGVIRVKLGKAGKIAPGKTRSIVVKMKTDIPVREDRFGVVKNKKGKLYTLSFCFPYLADNVRGNWQLDPYFDDGESRSWDLADYDVTFKAPKSYKVAATGRSTTTAGVTKVQAEKVRDFAIVACDYMDKDTFKVKGITVNNYYLKGSKYLDLYRKVSRMVAKDSIRLYTDNIGEYPYDELDITPCIFGFSFGGMEYPGLIMTNATSFVAGSMPDPWSLSEGVSHEIGHQWFYAAVGNREYKEGWLDEGFTTYLEKDVYGLALTDSYEYLRRVDEYYPSIDDSFKARDEIIQYARKDYKKRYVNVPPDKYPKDQNYGEAEYDEGYAFLQEVRVKLGDDKFSDFIREYYETYSMKRAKTKDVVRLIMKYDSSDEMNEIISFYVK